MTNLPAIEARNVIGTLESLDEIRCTLLTKYDVIPRSGPVNHVHNGWRAFGGNFLESGPSPR